MGKEYGDTLEYSFERSLSVAASMSQLWAFSLVCIMVAKGTEQSRADRA